LLKSLFSHGYVFHSSPEECNPKIINILPEA
jgi:hypothetical protein